MPSPINIPTNRNPTASSIEDFSAKRGRPMLFQVCDPIFQRPLYPVLLALHVNPSSLSEKMQKSKNVVSTYGGFVEFIWPDELDTLSADGTSGAFISPRTGLTSDPQIDMVTTGRQGTIAWERQEDLLDLFRQNGAVYNGAGQPVLRGRIMCIYDRGIFCGHFSTFQVSEVNDKAFTFHLSWEFKVEQTIYKYPMNAGAEGFPGSVNVVGNMDEQKVSVKTSFNGLIVDQDVSPSPILPGVNQGQFEGPSVQSGAGIRSGKGNLEGDDG